MGGQMNYSEQMQEISRIKAGLFRERIEALAEVYGSIRGVGRALNIDHVYLHRLMNGEKGNPSVVVLRKLGLTT